MALLDENYCNRSPFLSGSIKLGKHHVQITGNQHSVLTLAVKPNNKSLLKTGLVLQCNGVFPNPGLAGEIREL